ncbi:MAG: hypothetical protein WKF82_01685 [Nocardioidaceae bacterium]
MASAAEQVRPDAAWASVQIGWASVSPGATKSSGLLPFLEAGSTGPLDRGKGRRKAFRADVVSVDAGRAFGDHLDGTPETGIELLALMTPRGTGAVLKFISKSWKYFQVT